MQQESGSSEVSLWTACREGDQSAFGCLFDLHKDRVFRHAFRLLADRSDAEDILGTVFFELWRKRDTVHVVDGSLLPWLLLTATNSALNLRRATRRYRHLLSRLPREDHELSAEDQVYLRSNGLSPELDDALRGLNPTDQGLVALVIIEGYPIAEAAMALEIGPSVARKRLSRLRVRLRESLSGASTVDLALEGNGS
ncbi:sigma-70 family RNA polymerase sigma factor [Herbiconiux sp. CPCC 203407]|uniref:Sigma-70 family RNA polymerase sigma factor n=1 Tax=Herbiconiux oxytropis TaxID=2970915 RepID=A0AA42BW95_9MICO|nr:RNA polymerase sigma factor [Herbiconiux oxytropis]MCS5722126.1 sigma-70 family RNA polymerase sigma factor [Herbiconiux oxytropis]MCS5725708.1 sigma-70 family RNA polymerase sigma factor [Herbiconiux oxytropis]